MTTSAVYARSLLPLAEEILAAGRLRPLYLLEAVPARLVTADELRNVDPELESLRDCNTPADYQAALARAGVD
jgi:molybdopterin-guanine dinucleotide biosynthesis protein A